MPQCLHQVSNGVLRARWKRLHLVLCSRRVIWRVYPELRAYKRWYLLRSGISNDFKMPQSKVHLVWWRWPLGLLVLRPNLSDGCSWKLRGLHGSCDSWEWNGGLDKSMQHGCQGYWCYHKWRQHVSGDLKAGCPDLWLENSRYVNRLPVLRQEHRILCRSESKQRPKLGCFKVRNTLDQ